jgi:K(+)-stimulated pyrophosphate-energized sodium pump
MHIQKLRRLFMRRWRALSVAAILLAGLAIPGRLMAQEAPAAPATNAAGGHSPYFEFLTSARYSDVEKGALWIVLLVAVAGLAYAGMLVGQVLGADQGTEKMRTVAAAIRAGANAYLARQFRAIILLVFLITAIVWATTTGGEPGGANIPIGRAAAFFMGAAFSWIVG